MKSKHTQGNWIESNNNDSNEKVIRCNGNIICNMDADRHKACISDKENKANIKLITAAPDMLEALQTALTDMQMLLSGECENTPDNIQGTIHTLEIAIYKATK